MNSECIFVLGIWRVIVNTVLIVIRDSFPRCVVFDVVASILEQPLDCTNQKCKPRKLCNILK